MERACQSVHYFGPDGNISTNMGWSMVNFGADIHVPIRMNCNTFSDPLTFQLAPPSGQDFNYMINSTGKY